jgi:hypothetical protein
MTREQQNGLEERHRKFETFDFLGPHCASMKSNSMKSNSMKSNSMKSDSMKSNSMKSDSMKSNI